MLLGLIFVASHKFVYGNRDSKIWQQRLKKGPEETH
jgi:hypothetical protein